MTRSVVMQHVIGCPYRLLEVAGDPRGQFRCRWRTLPASFHQGFLGSSMTRASRAFECPGPGWLHMATVG